MSLGLKPHALPVRFVLTLALLLGFAHADARPGADLPPSEFSAINTLVEVQTETPAPTLLKRQIDSLNARFPSESAKYAFFKDWFAALNELARESTEFIIVNHARSAWLLNFETDGFRGGNGTFDKWIMSRDLRLTSLRESGHLFLPLYDALISPSDELWKEFETHAVRSMHLSHTEMEWAQSFLSPRLSPARNVRNTDINVGFLVAVLGSTLLNPSLLTNWERFNREPSPETIQRAQLRKLRLLEIVLENGYFDRLQKDEIATDIAELIKAASSSWDREYAELYRKQFLFEPMINKIQALSKYFSPPAASILVEAVTKAGSKSCQAIFL